MARRDPVRRVARGMRPSSVVFAASAMLVAAPAAAATRPVVVELFTSEGCSSCPPADAYLNTLGGRADILPLAFHVTYWNALGWRDPFSTETATSRQAMYAARLGGGSYTPEMVVDGRRALVGSDRDAAASAIAGARPAAAEAISVQAGRDGDRVRITVARGAGRGRVMLVGYDPRHETWIGRGENGGRRLVESNIVRSLRTVGTYEGDEVSLLAPRGDGQEAAVIVQGYDGRILGAARL